MYETLNDLEENIEDSQENPIKQKKRYKWTLIVFWILIVFIWAWAWLTKAWIIPNWLGIEVLCSENSKELKNLGFDNIEEDNKYLEIDNDAIEDNIDDENLITNNTVFNNFLDETECWKILNIEWYSNEDYGKRADTKAKEKGSIEYTVSYSSLDYSHVGYETLYTLFVQPDYKEWLDEIFPENKDLIIDCEKDRLDKFDDYLDEKIALFDNQDPIEPSQELDDFVHKPIIYLYPTTETKVHVELWTPQNLSHTYPKYNPEKWRNVIAEPNGDLEDMDTWRKLYALYREWKSDNETNFDEWFVVAWEDIIPFLEEKLAILWLNEREAEEFIVYWLPQMEGNEWNLIRFETIEEQNENMSLNITPTPDTVIRVMMDWKAINEPVEIPEQQLFTPERNGFTVVEWWGSSRN